MILLLIMALLARNQQRSHKNNLKGHKYAFSSILSKCNIPYLELLHLQKPLIIFIF